MENIINNIVTYKYIYIGALLLVMLIVLLLVLRPKKVKPIEVIQETEKEEEPKSEIEKVIEALEENKVDRPMTTFEEEQEANAIISYQELVKAVEEKRAKYDTKPSELISQVETPKVEMNVENLVSSIVSKEEPVIEKNAEPELKVETTLNTLDIDPEIKDLLDEKPKFKNSEFISPIFGKDSNKTNDDFLKELKDFRNNL